MKKARRKASTMPSSKCSECVAEVCRRSVARYEAHVAKLDNHSGFVDLYWPGVLIVVQKSAGHDLKAAYEQAGGYFDALRERERPRYILVSDFPETSFGEISIRKLPSARRQRLSETFVGVRLHR